jgi:undecaprenyl diphosphate synthase
VTGFHPRDPRLFIMAIASRLSAARSVLGLGKMARSEPRLPLARVPSSIAIIMDGNGRWARAHGLPTGAGHRAGARALKEVVRRAGDLGVRDLTVFSFSTENWNRPKDEVDDLMVLFSEMIDREVPELHAEGVQIRFIGRRDDLDSALRARIDDAETLTAANGRLRLFIAMNYGGRQEILDAAGRLADQGVTAPTDEQFRAALYGPDLRDPELVIRTSGEQRLSNFLLWQSAYSELYFAPQLWPDFGADDLEDAIADYAGRARRFGGR